MRTGLSSPGARFCSMLISYNIQSAFFLTIEEAIRSQEARLRQGSTIEVNLGPGGYDGDVYLRVEERSADEFRNDWVGNDPTRFPARIRAAASVLRNLGLWGHYRVVHQNGVLRLRRVGG